MDQDFLSQRAYGMWYLSLGMTMVKAQCKLFLKHLRYMQMSQDT